VSNWLTAPSQQTLPAGHEASKPPSSAYIHMIGPDPIEPSVLGGGVPASEGPAEPASFDCPSSARPRGRRQLHRGARSIFLRSPLSSPAMCAAAIFGNNRNLTPGDPGHGPSLSWAPRGS
jgi:hypothetical protein